MRNIILFLIFCLAQLIILNPSVAQRDASVYQPNKLIIQFADDATPSDKEAILRELGARERAFYPKLNISQLELSFPINVYDETGNNSTLDDILDVQGHIILKAEVDGAGLDYSVSLPSSSNGSSNSTAAPLPYCSAVDIYCPSAKQSSNKLKIGVIDTGIDAWLAMDLQQSYNYPSTSLDLDFTSPSYVPIDYHGHGTQMTSIITTILATQNISDFTLYPLKALNADGTGYISDIIAAIDFAICEQIDILNLSLGYIPTDKDVSGSFLQAVLQKAVNNNILPVVSAGNQSLDLGANAYYPATLDVSDMLTVGATDCDAGIASFSNYGSPVNVKTPGTDVLCQTLNEDWILAQGTSHAAAITTAVAAQLAQHQFQFDAAQIACVLEDVSVDVIDADLATALILSGSCAPISPITINTPTGSNTDDAIDAKWTSYPNPTTDILFIPYHFHTDEQQGEILVYGQDGRLIRRVSIEGNRKGVLSLPVASLAEGTYFYQFVIQEQLQAVQKFQVLR